MSVPATTLSHPAMHHDADAARHALKQEALGRVAEKNAIRQRHLVIHVIGRVMLAAVFLISGVAKIGSFATTAAAMTDAGYPSSGMMLTLAILLELGLGVMLAAGYHARVSAIALASYLFVVTLGVHSDLSVALNRAFLVSNMAILAGLLLLASHGAGVASLDVLLARRRARQFGL